MHRKIGQVMFAFSAVWRSVVGALPQHGVGQAVAESATVPNDHRINSALIGPGGGVRTRIHARGAVTGRILPYLLLVAISLPALLLRLGGYPAPWHDGGSRTNAARTLAKRGIYGTYTTEGFRPFDPYITSGPMDVVAVTTSFRLLGEGVVQG